MGNVKRIKVLPDIVKKKIAAGEVVEGPFSVIKELIENSIDADADQIDIQVADSGLKKIMVKDNGHGIARDDIALAVAEHATSKIEDIGDIERIGTYGFRGEALSSISSVSRLAILTRTAGEDIGGRLEAADGSMEVTDYAGPVGTTVIVENLFYNIPARKKFLKSRKTEMRFIREALLRIAVAHPGISFTLDVDGKRAVTLTRDDTPARRIERIYGKDMMKELYEVSLQDLKVAVTGYLSRPGYCRSARNMQVLYVNKRPVEYKYLGFLLSRAYEPVAEKGRHPAAFIFIDIEPDLVDVNIHPAKREVKLFDQRYIDSLIVSLADKAVGREHRLDERLLVPLGVPSGLSSGHAARGDESALGGPLFEETGLAYSGGGNGPDLRGLVRETETLYRDIRAGTGCRVMGIAFGTYLVLEKGDALYFIDYHAAHERILYDSILLKNETYESQLLAFPRIMELSIEDYHIIIENIDFFSEIGFDMDDFSDNSIRISAVPEIAAAVDAAEIIDDFVESVKDGHAGATVAEKLAAAVACHSARRAGDSLTHEEMEALAELVHGDERELRCPHGRPFVYRLDKKDLERMFKRT